jgi:hypothetical protein
LSLQSLKHLTTKSLNVSPSGMLSNFVRATIATESNVIFCKFDIRIFHCPHARLIDLRPFSLHALRALSDSWSRHWHPWNQIDVSTPQSDSSLTVNATAQNLSPSHELGWATDISMLSSFCDNSLLFELKLSSASKYSKAALRLTTHVSVSYLDWPKFCRWNGTKVWLCPWFPHKYPPACNTSAWLENKQILTNESWQGAHIATVCCRAQDM